MSEPSIDPLKEKPLREAVERIDAMIHDGGETWDLTGNDKAALKLVLAAALTAQPEPSLTKPLKEGYSGEEERLSLETSFDGIKWKWLASFPRHFHYRVTVDLPESAAHSAVPSERDELVQRITGYLASGGLFNPEMAIHERVRDLLIDCRAALSQDKPTRAGEGETKS